jgi:glycogen(starch) synthase
LLPTLARRGHEIVVVTGRDAAAELPAHATYEGMEVHRLPLVQAIRDRDLDALARTRRAVAKIVRDLRPHLLHAAFTGPGIWALPKPQVAPLILSFHGVEQIDFAAPGGLFARTLDRAAWITACSRAALEGVLGAAPQIGDRASVVPYGLEPPAGGEPPQPPAGPPMVLCARRMVREKGMDLAIEAFATLASTDHDARLVMAGDGPERPALESRVRELGIADRVTFTGWVAPPDMPALVAAATIVLIPSRSEGFGLVALEAALMARPVIAAGVGGLREAVDDGVTGLLVPREDTGAMTDAIRRLLTTPALARSLGQAGRRRALTMYSAERQAADWDALYRRFAARH